MSTGTAPSITDIGDTSSSRLSRSSATVAHIAFFTCLILQRFGLQFTNSFVSISAPVLFGLAGWMVINKTARFDPGRSILYLIFAAWTLVSTTTALLWPVSDGGFSILSLLNLLLTYVVLTIRPVAGFDARRVHNIFLGYARVLAVLSIVQFILQLGGIQLYAMSQLIPALQPVLIEQNYAFDPVLSYGSITRRSNGFFLLEPSILSQVIVIALVLDFLVQGRKKYLLLYAIAYLTSYSGTGLLALIVTLGFVGLSSLKNFSRVLAIGVAALFAGLVFSVAVPEQFGIFADRVNELSAGAEGSSGYARFAAQGKQISAALEDARCLVGFGPGATARSRYWTAGSGNAALQLFIDYGFVGLLLFYIFFIKLAWNARHSALSVVLIAVFQLGGGYLLFGPFSLLFAALAIWGSTATLILPIRNERSATHFRPRSGNVPVA